jgi:hypothetical protein
MELIFSLPLNLDTQTTEDSLCVSEQLSRSPPPLIAPIALRRSQHHHHSTQACYSNTYLCLRRPFIVDNAVLRTAESTCADVSCFTRLARPAAAEAVAVHAYLYIVVLEMRLLVAAWRERGIMLGASELAMGEVETFRFQHLSSKTRPQTSSSRPPNSAPRRNCSVPLSARPLGLLLRRWLEGRPIRRSARLLLREEKLVS